MLRPYQNYKEDLEIVDRWHAANKKSDGRAKKDKSKDNQGNSNAKRRSGFSMPHSDTEHRRDIAVDDIQDLDDAPIKF